MSESEMYTIASLGIPLTQLEKPITRKEAQDLLFPDLDRLKSQSWQQIAEDIRGIAETGIRSLAAQREAFLEQHMDKAGTHNLCLYPTYNTHDGDTTTHHQPMVLMPKDETGEYTFLAAQQQFPWSIASFDIVSRKVEESDD